MPVNIVRRVRDVQSFSARAPPAVNNAQSQGGRARPVADGLESPVQIGCLQINEGAGFVAGSLIETSP